MAELKLEEIKKLSIYEKLLKITEELPTVGKNLEVTMGKGSYKAVGEADVLRAVRPLEVKYRVYSYPMVRNIVKDENVVVSKTYKDTTGKSNTTESISVFFRTSVVYRFVNIDSPTQFVDIVSFGDGVDSQDKAPGKSMTYADKYALLKAYKIQTGDDPDGTASESMTPVKQTVASPKVQANTKQPTPVMPTTATKPEEKTTPNPTLTTVKTSDVSAGVEEIKGLCDTLIQEGVARTDIAMAIKKHFVDGTGKPSANYMKITDEDTIKKVADELKSMRKGGK